MSTFDETGDSGWTAMAAWAQELAREVDLDALERSYKLDAASRWRAAGEACAANDPGWWEVLRRARNFANLVDSFSSTWLGNQHEARPDAVRRAFGDLHRAGTVSAVDEFAAALTSWGDYISPGDVTTYASLVLLGLDPTSHPPYRAQFVSSWADRVGEHLGPTPRERLEGLYRLCDGLLGTLDGAEPALRDRLDAQGLAWTTIRHPAPYRWSPLHRAELLAWRSGAAGPVSFPRGAGRSPQLEDAAWSVLGPALRGEESGLVPGSSFWTVANAQDLAVRLTQDAVGGTFHPRLISQLDDASDGVRGLAAELLLLRDIPLFDMRPATKRLRTNGVLATITGSPSLPEAVSTALDSAGAFRGGQGYHAVAHKHLQWLCRFVVHWLETPDDERHDALRDPFAFRRITAGTPEGSPAIRYVIEYLAWPGVFPSVVSDGHRREIRDGLIGELGAASGPDDEEITRDLVALRAYHQEARERGGYPYWYGSPYVEKWKKGADAPRAWLVRPGGGGADLVADWLAQGFVSLNADLLAGLTAGIGQAAVQAAVASGYQHEDKSQQEELTVSFYRFLTVLKDDDLVATVDGHHLLIGTVTGDAEFVDAPGNGLRRPVEWSSVRPALADVAEPVPKLLDQQGHVVDLTAAYVVLSDLVSDDAAEGDDEPIADRPSAEKVPTLAKVTEELASSLFMPTGHLQEMVDLLQSRQQIVLYGPPGTGKTYVAKALARHVAGADDPSRVRLVQFHPSYAYEDFFEGYRPSLTETGQATFALQDGPLKQLAAEASSPDNRSFAYVLIIDEMNRANLAKVFGELYYLLEYRKDTVRLQYQPKTPFSLPSNLFIIGTMNTADRSIALVDAAIRRRFAFYELHPGEEPVKGVLSRYVAGRQVSDDRVDLLHELNVAMGSRGRDLHIGPSYLMRAEVDTPSGLERVWRFDILPLLQEHYYGQKSPDEVRRDFGLAELRKRIAKPTTATATVPSGFVGDPGPAASHDDTGDASGDGPHGVDEGMTGAPD